MGEKTIGELLKITNLTKPSASLGVEVEVEGLTQLPLEVAGWRVERDGSLRDGGLEYVFDGPTPLATAKRRLTALSKALPKKLRSQRRAGVHVHVNMQHYTLKQAYTFLTAYLVLEPYLMKYCGEHREHNLFCLATYNATGFYSHLREAYRGWYQTWASESIRYCSVNMSSLFRYGSIEFRGMRTPQEGLEPVFGWVELVDRLQMAIGLYDSPTELLQDVIDSGLQVWAKGLLGELSGLLTIDEPSNIISHLHLILDANGGLTEEGKHYERPRQESAEPKSASWAEAFARVEAGGQAISPEPTRPRRATRVFTSDVELL